MEIAYTWTRPEVIFGLNIFKSTEQKQSSLKVDLCNVTST